MRKQIYPLSLFLLLGIGFFLRFLFLTWGFPFFFHPDENNITNAILQLSLKQWNPHFFAYGGLPIYFSFLTSFTSSLGKLSFAEIAYSLRLISATLSLLLIPSLFYIGKRLYNQKTGFYAAALSTVSIGFIQFAHFGTFEMWLTFLTLWLFYSTYLLYKNPTIKHILLTGIVAGALLSTKISGAVFIFIPLLTLLFTKQSKTTFFKKILLYLFLVGGIYILTNPYLILDSSSFLSSLSYESSVALGTLPVFYTQSFLHTVPVLFQLQHVLPFLLNPLIFIIFLFSFVLFVFFVFKFKKSADILLLFFFCTAFFSQAFLFVKWVRYIVPALPFIYLILGITLSKIKQSTSAFLISFLFLFSLIVSCVFLQQTYATDSRIVANNFVVYTLKDMKTIVEPYDLGAIVFTQTLPQAKIINIYDLEKDAIVQNELQRSLRESSLFLSPSQRLLHTRLSNKVDFPKGNTLYTQLLAGSLGFHIAYQTPCSVWCHIIYFGNPLSGSSEETASVFDHPFITIFSKK